MALRPGMVDVVQRVRDLIGDAPSTSMQFSDNDIQRACDDNSFVATYRALRPVQTVYPGGSVLYLDFYADTGPWEGTVGLSLVNGNYGTIIPTTSDLRIGHWHFAGSATSPYEPARPVMLSGNTFDVYAASADLLEEWAAYCKDAVDTKDPNATFSLSQQYQHYTAQANLMRRRARPRVVRMFRSDGG